jgi:hypothetical protein
MVYMRAESEIVPFLLCFVQGKRTTAGCGHWATGAQMCSCWLSPWSAGPAMRMFWRRYGDRINICFVWWGVCL